MSAFSPTRSRGSKDSSRSPSKKILPVAATCIVTIALALIFVFYNPQSAQPQSATSLAVVNQSNATGLANAVYQKIQAELTALATSSADTSANNSANAATASSTIDSKPPTATQALSQEFISDYLSMKQSGQTLTADQESSLIPELIQNGNITQYIPQPQVFSSQNITVTSDTSAAALRAYGNAVGAIIKKNSVPQNINELDILQTAVNSQNPADLANLAIIIKSYSGIVSGLAKTPVPPEAEVLHLALLNDFSEALNCVQGMNALFTDPVFAVSAIQDYEQVAPAVYNDLSAFTPLFAKYGVTFSAAEAGSIFTTQTPTS